MTKGLENAKSECNKLQEKNDTINQKLLTFSHCDVSKEEETRQIKASVASLNAKVINKYLTITTTITNAIIKKDRTSSTRVRI